MKKNSERRIVIEMHTDMITAKAQGENVLELDQDIIVKTAIGYINNIPNYGRLIIVKFIDNNEIKENDIEVIGNKLEYYLERLKEIGASMGKYFIEVVTESKDEKSQNFVKIKNATNIFDFKIKQFPQENTRGFSTIKRSEDGKEALLIEAKFTTNYADKEREQVINEMEKKAEDTSNQQLAEQVKMEREKSINSAKLTTGIKYDYHIEIEKLKEVVYKSKIKELCLLNDNILKMGE